MDTDKIPLEIPTESLMGFRQWPLSDCDRIPVGITAESLLRFRKNSSWDYDRIPLGIPFGNPTDLKKTKPFVKDFFLLSTLPKMAVVIPTDSVKDSDRIHLGVPIESLLGFRLNSPRFLP